jgi:hypothetical protein
VLSVQFLLLPLAIIPDVRLQRRLEYKQRSLVELSAALVGSQATLFMALFGAGVWSLVAGMLATQAWRMGALNWCAPGQPRPDWSLAGMGKLLGFAVRLPPPACCGTASCRPTWPLSAACWATRRWAGTRSRCTWRRCRCSAWPAS